MSDGAEEHDAGIAFAIRLVASQLLHKLDILLSEFPRRFVKGLVITKETPDHIRSNMLEVGVYRGKVLGAREAADLVTCHGHVAHN